MTTKFPSKTEAQAFIDAHDIPCAGPIFVSPIAAKFEGPSASNVIAAKTVLKRGGDGRHYAAREDRVETRGNAFVLYSGGLDPLVVHDLDTAMSFFEQPEASEFE